MSLIPGRKDKAKKEALIRSAQTLQQCMHKYFSVTNRLLQILNAHLDHSTSPVVLANQHHSIEENCARVKDQIHTILEISERNNKHVCKSVEPAVYEQIVLCLDSVKDKAAALKDLHQKTLGLLGNVLAPLVTVHLIKSDLRSIMPPVEHSKLAPVLPLTLEDLMQTSREISKLMCRSGNPQNKLEEAVSSLEDAVSVLKPPCDLYDDIVCELEAYITIMSENM